MVEGSPNIEFLMLSRGVSDHVCSVALTKEKKKGSPPGAPRKAGLLLFVSITPVDDQVRAVPQCPGEAAGSVGILPVAEIEGRVCASPVGDELIDPEGRVDRS